MMCAVATISHPEEPGGRSLLQGPVVPANSRRPLGTMIPADLESHAYTVYTKQNASNRVKTWKTSFW